TVLALLCFSGSPALITADSRNYSRDRAHESWSDFAISAGYAQVRGGDPGRSIAGGQRVTGWLAGVKRLVSDLSYSRAFIRIRRPISPLPVAGDAGGCL